MYWYEPPPHPPPPADSPQSRSPPLSDSRPRDMDHVPLNLQRDVDGEIPPTYSNAEPRDRALSDTSTVSGVAPSETEKVANGMDPSENTEEVIRKNDVFIDMLVFGDQFLKHSRRGVCGRSLRHISVSADLKYLCRSHINNLKSMKTIPLTEIDR